MFAIQKLSSQAPRVLKVAVNQRRTMLVTAPRDRVSLSEKVILGVVLYIGIMAYPVYIACNVNKYNAKHPPE